jgi:hypothetical protein
MQRREPSRSVGEIATVGDLVFAMPRQTHRFGRVIEVTATSVTYQSIPVGRAIAVPGWWPAFWNVTEKGRCLVVG